MAIDSHLENNLAVTQYDFDPDATTETEIAWVPMKDFRNILVSFFRTVGTSDVTLKIQGATDSSGTGATDIVTKTVSSQPDAVGDYIFLEAGINDILAAGSGLDFVSAVVSVATGTDEGVISYIRGRALRPESGLTADVVA